eukprot:TRINITY_DN522_c0_g1_i2.p1 TRINITY_DN522_c0_g1~~TRINITY_DN522_c0_g1_i2.p1  ORF type:complete len:703 (-),score=203.38 TRINITY_DN522_c0_g1_i2:213-2321(-)
MTFVVYDKEMWSTQSQFRFNLKGMVSHGGDVTKWMAIPWQADFNECEEHWWPFQRPDAALPLDAYQRLFPNVPNFVNKDAPDFKAKEEQARANMRDLDAQVSEAFVTWTRGFRSNEPSHIRPKWADMDMTMFWDKLGFIMPMETDHRGNTWRIETERTLFETPKQGPPPLDPELGSLQELKWMLQMALFVELSTIPPYLYAMYSIKADPSDPLDIGPSVVHQIRMVAQEEMLHASLVCNIIRAIGFTPQLYAREMTPFYPNPLPHYHNDAYEDGSRQLIVHLMKACEENIKTFIKIESPAMHVNVKIDATPGFKIVEVLPQMTIGDIKSAIELQTGLTRDKYRLLFKTQTLNDDTKTVAQCAIQNDDDLQVQQITGAIAYMESMAVNVVKMVSAPVRNTEIAQRMLAKVFGTQPRPNLIALQYPSIGHFYADCKQKLIEVDKAGKISWPDEKQLEYQLGDGMGFTPQRGHVEDGTNGLFKVHNLKDALRAMDEIIEQGEGAGRIHSECKAETELDKLERMDESHSHFERFKAILTKINPDEANYDPYKPDSPKRDAFNPHFHVYNVLTDPTESSYTSYPKVAQVSKAFNACYGWLMIILEKAWSTANRSAKRDLMVGCMPALMKGALAPLAKFMMSLGLDKQENAGPTFEFYNFLTSKTPKEQVQDEVTKACQAYPNSSELSTVLQVISNLPDMTWNYSQLE